jgi:hypothetical protein
MTRPHLICFWKTNPSELKDSPAFSKFPFGTIVFALTADLDLPRVEVGESVTQQMKEEMLIRHESFDWKYGNQGRDFLLVTPEGKEAIDQLNRRFDLRWLNFPEAIKNGKLTSNQKRVLQLAVQFLSTSEEDQNALMASPVTDDLIHKLREKLQSPSDVPPNSHLPPKQDR